MHSSDGVPQRTASGGNYSVSLRCYTVDHTADVRAFAPALAYLSPTQQHGLGACLDADMILRCFMLRVTGSRCYMGACSFACATTQAHSATDSTAGAGTAAAPLQLEPLQQLPAQHLPGPVRPRPHACQHVWPSTHTPHSQIGGKRPAGQTTCVLDAPASHAHAGACRRCGVQRTASGQHDHSEQQAKWQLRSRQQRREVPLAAS